MKNSMLFVSRETIGQDVFEEMRDSSLSIFDPNGRVFLMNGEKLTKTQWESWLADALVARKLWCGEK